MMLQNYVKLFWVLMGPVCIPITVDRASKQEGIKQKVFRFLLVDTYVSDSFKEHFDKVIILFIADKAPKKLLPEYTKNYRGNTGRSESKFYKKMFGVTVVTDFMSMS